MITLKFAVGCNAKKVEDKQFETYKEFFEFYVANNDKGIIFAVKDDGNTK